MTPSDNSHPSVVPDFDAAIALTNEAGLTPEAAEAHEEMLWHGHLTGDWSIGPVPNGGYSGAVLVNALRSHTGADIASSLTTHYYRPTIPDAPFTIRTEIMKRGRTVTHADALLEQEGKVRCRSVALMGTYPKTETILATTPPPIASPDDCPARDPQSQGLNMSLLQSLDVRLDPSAEITAGPNGAGERIDGWVKFRDDRQNDALALTLFVDSFPPAVLITLPGTGWVPTLEMTTHIRAVAAPGWIRGEVTTANVRGGTLIEDVKLWDSTNTLVAEARQLALLLTS